MDKTLIHSPLQHFLDNAERHPAKIFLRQPKSGRYNDTSYAEAKQQSLAVARYLSENVTTANIAILSLNCDGWILADLSIMAAGKVSVPLYPTASIEHLIAIIEHSEAKVLLVGKLPDENKLSQIKSAFPKLEIISFFTSRSGETEWLQLAAEYQPIESVYQPDNRSVATIVYTSGTTGQPKGVVISYRAMDAVFNCVRQTLDLNNNERFFSYLPLSHVAERTAVELAACFYGCQISFVESLDTFSRNLADTQPTIFFAVPRIWDKFRQGIEGKLGGRRMASLICGLPWLGSKLKKILIRKLGLAEAKICLSAAAPISENTLVWFQQLGITIYEAYGMTESCGLSNLNRKQAFKLGSVGQPLIGCEVSIASNGEILLKNPGLMDGYYKEESLTQAVMQDDWLRTGDLGVQDKLGFLSITGRVKDLFKTSKGKYVAPIPIEHQIAAIFHLDQVCVMGQGLSQPIAVISAAGNDLTVNQIKTNLRRLEGEVKEYNKTLEKHERLQKIVISLVEWTPDNNLLTPTLKMRRQALEEYYLASSRELLDNPSLIVFLNDD